MAPEFYQSETVWANMKIRGAYIEHRGVSIALYRYKASHLRTTRPGGLHHHVEIPQKKTLQKARISFTKSSLEG